METKEDDWRIHGQDRYLLGAVLHFSVYRAPRKGWDHDHCAFCWAKFMEAQWPETLQAGYTTDDVFHWVRPQCFDDFQSRFQFTIRPRIGFD
jgi:hypothetical protein